MEQSSLEEHFQKTREKNCIWVAEEACLTPSSDNPFEAFCYQLVGFFRYEEEDQAFAWAQEGGTVTREECWAVSKEGRPRRTVTMLSIINPLASQLLVGRP